MELPITGGIFEMVSEYIHVMRKLSVLHVSELITLGVDMFNNQLQIDHLQM